MHQKPRGARRSLLGHLVRLSNLKIQSFRQFWGLLSDFIERITLNLISTWPRTKHYPFYTANTAPQTQCRADSSGAADVCDDDGHGRGATATGETRRDATAMIEVPRSVSVAGGAQLGPRCARFVLRWMAASTTASMWFCWLQQQRRRTGRSRGDRARARARARGLYRGRRSHSRWPSSSYCSRRCCLRMTAASRTTLARCSCTSRRTSTSDKPAREPARKAFGSGSIAVTLFAH